MLLACVAYPRHFWGLLRTSQCRDVMAVMFVLFTGIKKRTRHIALSDKKQSTINYLSTPEFINNIGKYPHTNLFHNTHFFTSYEANDCLIQSLPKRGPQAERLR